MTSLIDSAARKLHGWSNDPLAFVQEVFPWGKPGVLQNESGPDDWQIQILTAIRDGLNPNEALRIAIASGHGPGKSALVAWIILWGISTRVDARGIVTANTESQLRTKTWVELAKWYHLAPLISALFSLSATTFAARDDAHEKTWRLDQIAWSERNTEAFAGLHNQGRRIIVIFDEASAIPDPIWATTEGALTDRNTEILFLTCGNPTRNTGRFRECFERYRHRWLTFQIDSRTARLTNKDQIDQWIADYGEDSDFVRVRVRGVFPRAGSMQFISSEVAEAAMAADRDPQTTLYDPLVMGVDVARFGSDASVICFRRGRDARTIPWITLRDVDTMTLAARVVDLAQQHRPDAIFVDGGGVGGGVVDRLSMLRQPVREVQFGSKSDRAGPQTANSGIVFANKAAEMWGSMRDWLSGGAIPLSNELLSDLTGREFGYAIREGRDAVMLESKDDMRKRGLASPDLADALALTFAYEVAPSDHGFDLFRRPIHQVEYDPFADAYVGVNQTVRDYPSFENQPYQRAFRR